MDRSSVFVFVFNLNSMKLHDVLAHIGNYNLLIFIEFRWKTKKFFNETFNGRVNGRWIRPRWYYFYRIYIYCKIAHFWFLVAQCTARWSLMKRGHETRDDHSCMITHRSLRAYNLTPQIVGPSIKDYFAIYFRIFCELLPVPCWVKLGSKWLLCYVWNSFSGY